MYGDPEPITYANVQAGTASACPSRKAVLSERKDGRGRRDFANNWATLLGACSYGAWIRLGQVTQDFVCVAGVTLVAT